MRYLLQTNFQKELDARKAFLYDSIKLWFYETGVEDDFLELISMPNSCCPDILMILGHNYSVKNYLTSHTFPESLVVAITCDGNCNYKNLRLPNKQLYIPFQNENNLVDLWSGKKFNFDFDITESEILFYNSPKSLPLKKRIEKSFQNINKYRRK